MKNLQALKPKFEEIGGETRGIFTQTVKSVVESAAPQAADSVQFGKSKDLSIQSWRDKLASLGLVDAAGKDFAEYERQFIATLDAAAEPLITANTALLAHTFERCLHAVSPLDQGASREIGQCATAVGEGITEAQSKAAAALANSVANEQMFERCLHAVSPLDQGASKEIDQCKTAVGESISEAQSKAAAALANSAKDIFALGVTFDKCLVQILIAEPKVNVKVNNCVGAFETAWDSAVSQNGDLFKPICQPDGGCRTQNGTVAKTKRGMEIARILTESDRSAATLEQNYVREYKLCINQLKIPSNVFASSAAKCRSDADFNFGSIETPSMAGGVSDARFTAAADMVAEERSFAERSASTSECLEQLQGHHSSVVMSQNPMQMMLLRDPASEPHLDRKLPVVCIGSARAAPVMFDTNNNNRRIAHRRAVELRATVLMPAVLAVYAMAAVTLITLARPASFSSRFPSAFTFYVAAAVGLAVQLLCPEATLVPGWAWDGVLVVVAGGGSARGRRSG